MGISFQRFLFSNGAKDRIAITLNAEEEALCCETKRELDEWLEWNGWPAAGAPPQGLNGSHPEAGKKNPPTGDACRRTWVEFSAGA